MSLTEIGKRYGNQIPSFYMLDGVVASNVGYVSNLTVETVLVSSSDWTADSTGYQDAALMGNQTLYRADVKHHLNTIEAEAISFRYVSSGMRVRMIQLQTTEDPLNPGTFLTDTLRVWISADAAPAEDIYLKIIGS